MSSRFPKVNKNNRAYALFGRVGFIMHAPLGTLHDKTPPTSKSTTTRSTVSAQKKKGGCPTQGFLSYLSTSAVADNYL